MSDPVTQELFNVRFGQLEADTANRHTRVRDDLHEIKEGLQAMNESLQLARERVAALETKHTTVAAALLLLSAKTNWGAWVSAIVGIIGLAFALWASTIRPLESDLATLRPTVQDLTETTTRHMEQINNLSTTVGRIDRDGSPITRDRLAVLESQMRNVLARGGGVR
jgi:phage-related protein